MPQISHDENRAIQEGLFCFGLPDAVAPPALLRVASIPFEPLETFEELIKKPHVRCI